MTAEFGADHESEIAIIDTHQHLWDFNLFHPPWLAGEPTLDRSTTMVDYLLATKGLNVCRTIYMEVDVSPEEQLKEALWASEICEAGETPMAAAVVSCRPGRVGFDAYLAELRRHPAIRGLRQVLHGSDTPPGTCIRPEYLEDIRKLSAAGLSFDICIRPEELADAFRLAESCPEVRFILDHCGNGGARYPERDRWERDIFELAQRPNVVCKISGIIRTVLSGWDAVAELSPLVNHCIDQFGADRVMFGGDWPVCNLTSSFAGWVGCLKAILSGRSVSDQRKLFHDNAFNFYRL